MRHLAPAELVDYADGTLDAVRLAHADSCERCQRAAAAFRSTLDDVSRGRADVPEPSPLFWDHLSARVRDGIAEIPAQPSGWESFGVRTFVPLGAFAVLLAVLLTPLTTVRRAPVASSVAHDGVAGSVEIDRPLDPSTDPATAQVWEVLTAAGADLEWDAAHDAGMSVAPAAVDRAVQQLDAAELRELGRLLQSELKRSSN